MCVVQAEAEILVFIARLILVAVMGNNVAVDWVQKRLY
jgi:hypothetical protein